MQKDLLCDYDEFPGFENVRPCRGIRTERYKLIHFFLEPQEWELYDLDKDPEGDEQFASEARLGGNYHKVKRPAGPSAQKQATNSNTNPQVFRCTGPRRAIRIGSEKR